jgi:hypothetical protein
VALSRPAHSKHEARKQVSRPIFALHLRHAACTLRWTHNLLRSVDLGAGMALLKNCAAFTKRTDGVSLAQRCGEQHKHRSRWLTCWSQSSWTYCAATTAERPAHRTYSKVSSDPCTLPTGHTHRN